MPGLINGHYHSTSSFYRGCWDGDPLEIYLLHLEPEPSSPEYQTERFYYLRAMLGAMEMARLGITSVRDDAVFSPIPSFEAIDGLMSAYRDIGMRAQVSLEQVDLPEIDKHPYLRGILPDHICAKLSEEPPMGREALLGQYHHLINQWNGAADSRLTAALTCSGPQRVSTEYFQELAHLARTYDLSLNGHILETKVQCVMGPEKFGKSLIRYVHDLGFLDERFVVIHAVWAGDDDIEIMAESGCAVAHNPVSNLKIGSGVMPFRKIQEAGIPICIGTDEPSIDDTVNLWGVTKVGALVQKVADPDYRNWPKANEYLKAMTNGGAHAMRCPTSRGAIALGYDADIILLDLDTLAFTPLNDLRRQLVYSETGSSVCMTMVAGEVIFEDGVLLNVDEAAIKAEINQIVQGFMKEAREATSYATEYEPYFREMYLKAARKDMGFNRWIEP
ncbi:MAG: amidohydrolase family protein [Rhodospirillales bacterium]|nr:amidohydrolase family protein [Rhodospirillales bacterium]